MPPQWLSRLEWVLREGRGRRLTHSASTVKKSADGDAGATPHEQAIPGLPVANVFAALGCAGDEATTGISLASLSVSVCVTWAGKLIGACFISIRLSSFSLAAIPEVNLLRKIGIVQAEVSFAFLLLLDGFLGGKVAAKIKRGLTSLSCQVLFDEARESQEVRLIANQT